MSSRLSIIVPALNEESGIVRTLDCFQILRARGHEVILVDGGSVDNTVRLARPLVDRIVKSVPGRARQMNAGAAEASGDIFWFVHADTLVPLRASQVIVGEAVSGEPFWGRFDVRIDASGPAYRVIETLMNLRSRWSGIATGDQGIFISRSLFESVAGFPEQPLMEDIEISRRLRAVCAPSCPREQVLTSGRRWRSGGILATVLLMWRLRFAYFVGVSPDKLALRYQRSR